jgi:hypothetical protein
VKAWAIGLVALIAGAAAVSAAIFIPSDDARRERSTNVGADQPAFTVIDGDEKAKASAAPTASPAPARIGSSEGGTTPVSDRGTGGSSIDVTNGEFAESSDGEDELEAEREAEEEEARQKAKEEADEQRCEEKKEQDPDHDC